METHEKIKHAREQKGYTQKEVAEMINVTDMQLRRWEKNQSEMGITKLKELCKLYGVSADYILGLPKGLQWPR